MTKKDELSKSTIKSILRDLQQGKCELSDVKLPENIILYDIHRKKDRL